MRSREEIYTDITEERYFVLRHEYTPRIWARLDFLLDELLEVQYAEAVELLNEEANEGVTNGSQL